MQIRVSATTTIDCPRPRVYEYATSDAALPKLFVGYGAIPAIKLSETLDLPAAAGSKRRITNSDGSVLTEEILELTAPTAHRYRIVAGLKVPFSLLVKVGEGSWTFADVGGRTKVTWDYAFTVTNILAWPSAALLIKTQFRPAMQRALDRLREQLEV
jgi:uncharacterized protein YndB with AHSA1/START domain